jgi:NitT/TauT family transport system substrate-binding protein
MYRPVIAVVVLAVLVLGSGGTTPVMSPAPADARLAAAQDGPQAPEANPAGALTPVAYGADFLISGATAPISLAIERGYFAEGGIEVSVSRGFGSTDAVRRAATGQADVVQGDIGSAMLQRANQGAQAKVVSPLYGRVPFAVLFYEDLGIRTPRDLEGRTLADAAGSAPRVLFPAFAGVAGIDPARVEFTTVDASTRNAQFAAGQLSIITAFILNLADAEAVAYASNPNRRIGALRYADYGLDMYGNGYITSDHFIAEKPQAVAAFVAGAAKGLRDTYLDVPAAADAVRRQHAEVDRDVAIRELELIKDLVLTDDVRANGIGTFDEARLQRTQDIMRQYFEVRRDIPLAETYTTQFLPRPPVMP